MCNCGNKRSGLTASSPAAPTQSVPVNKAAQKTWPDVTFMYTGQSALTATGNMTGKRYRFSGPGDRQMVDYRDAPSMMTVPVLKKV
ncbi:MAG: hypothetical protein ABIR15_00545 [Chitinophagaceae bacterium]